MMNWADLLSDRRFSAPISDDKEKRFPGVERAKRNTCYTPFAEDYQRVLSSSSFRALQDKTQVFSLDESDFVRTRLTHSMEVSAIARELGNMVVKCLGRKQDIDENLKPTDAQGAFIPDILATAGLLHDLGNPPFGHFGEEIISSWLSLNLKSMTKYYDAFCPDVDDLVHFEGNAQTLRILMKKNGVGDMADINPTYAVLSSITKYTCCFIPDDSNILEHHKRGFYLSEKPQFEAMASQLGTMSSNKPISRHPLAFLLEAADDIAYRTADFEDAFKKGLVTIDELRKLSKIISEVSDDDFLSKYPKETLDHLFDLVDEGYDLEYLIHYWIRQIRLLLMNAAEFIFVLRIDSIMDGAYHQELLSDEKCFHKITLDIFKEIMNNHVYPHRQILEKELLAKTILEALLERMVAAVLVRHAHANNDHEDAVDPTLKKYYLLLPDNVRHQLDEESSRDTHPNRQCYEELRAVIDFISGLTDSGATRLYRLLARA